MGAPAPPAQTGATKLQRLVQWATGPFWVVPATWCTVAVVAGVLLPAVESDATGSWILFDAGPESARSVLSTIAGAMISVTGLVFSITIVVLQLASSQFTPRVVGSFLTQRIPQHTLGVFTASFLYSLMLLRAVETDPDSPQAQVPQISISIALVLVLAAVLMFLAFIHHITRSISVGVVIRRIGDDCRDLLTSGRTGADHLLHEAPDLPATRRQRVVVAPRSGYLDLVDRERLCRLGSSHSARIEILHPLGTFVPEGSPLALVHEGDDTSPSADWPDLVCSGLELTLMRSMRQDLSLGFRRLVDIAERALSPGVNDPSTAVEVIDQLHDVLRRLAAMRGAYPVTSDEEGIPRVVTRDHSFEDYLDQAIDEIAHYGRDDLQIPHRLDMLLHDLASAAVPERAIAIRAKHESLTRER